MLNGWKFLTDDDIARIERGIVENAVHGGPWHVELQPSNACNVECFFCISRFGRNNEMLDWSVLNKFLVENRRRRDLRMLRLVGGGEPLLYTHIRELLDLCGEHGILLENVTTNGTLLAPLSAQIMQTGLDCMVVSLNESSPALYGKTMRAPERFFYNVLDGIAAITAARDAAPANRRPRIWVQFFVWKGNASRIVETYEFARTLGPDTIFFRTFMGSFIKDRLTEADRAMVETQLREIIRLDAERGEFKLHFDLGGELALHRFTHAEQARHNPPISENFPDFHPACPRTEYCFVGWFNCAINARGEVFPCFQYHNMPLHEVGNIYRESMDEIWRGERYRTFRDQIHELMRLRGRMEPSEKYNRFIEKKCADCMRCNYTFNLATPEFYERVTRQVQARHKIGERVRARVKNTIIYGAHRLLRRPT